MEIDTFYGDFVVKLNFKLTFGINSNAPVKLNIDIGTCPTTRNNAIKSLSERKENYSSALFRQCFPQQYGLIFCQSTAFRNLRQRYA